MVRISLRVFWGCLGGVWGVSTPPIFGYILKDRVCLDRFKNLGSGYDLAK